jgi:hypothetical protein
MERGTIHIRKGATARWDDTREEYDVRVLTDRPEGGILVGAVRRGTSGGWAAFRYREADADRWTPRNFLGCYSSPTAAAGAVAR